MKATLYDYDAGEYNKVLAEALKKVAEFEVPEWSVFVKTGPAKARPIDEEDFWFKRAASILRQIYINKIVGVNRLRTRYGSKQNRGMKPEKFKKAGGKIIRVILQQGEAAGFLEKANVKRAGRRLTVKGKEFLDSIKVGEKIVEKPVEVKKEVVEEVQDKVEEKKE